MSFPGCDSSGRVDIVKDPENPVAPAVFEQAILDIAAGVRKLNASRLTRRALVVLIRDSCRVAARDIDAVLNALDKLEREYLKPKTVAPKDLKATLDALDKIDQQRGT